MRGEDKQQNITKVRLPAGSLLRIEGDCREVVIFCLAGSPWVTQEGDFKDHFLEPGEEFAINRAGLVVVQALIDTDIGIKEGGLCSPNLTLVMTRSPDGGPSRRSLD